MSPAPSGPGDALRQLIGDTPVIPVLQVLDAAHAVPLARALVAGGLPVLEITLRTDAALPAMERIAREVPEAIIAAGTVRDVDALRRAADCGARFAVSPGLTPALAEAEVLPLLPGVMTPSEVMRARDAGYSLLKLFPAEQAGGIAMLKALAGPFPELQFCPTGGVTAASAPDYLARANVLCVGGSWFAPAAVQAAEDWDTVRRYAVAAAALRHTAA